MAEARAKLGPQATWAMAVGGMIGGGIYTLAGVLLALAGPLAWISLVLGALVAAITTHSYTGLALPCGECGVPVSIFLQEGRTHTAGILAWGLVVLYVLAIAVYAFTFGHYVAAAFGAPPGVVLLLGAGVIATLIAVNVLGIEEPVA